jgi:hypothetical protein
MMINGRVWASSKKLSNNSRSIDGVLRDRNRSLGVTSETITKGESVSYVFNAD